ncbi:endonuclease/exonuclease/phosphatase family protein [Paractinoplanes atraurantiacus]|uniref:Vancomycin resistance protein VanJ n=1 Tax=Paractinoplanes atraurantiacus TaxID=1036182 RepID=A0A285J5F6_9ACTN|nr:endonuclease/exonuclease/phosphatase family protein [Actinoplanes atraurantiacus]SNY54331.1 vancomycin resistance protein VanJ [Actinoplanes atraurantiacus]
MRGYLIIAMSVLLAGLLALHRWVPGFGLRLGSLLETFLPWLGLAVPVLAALAWWRRPRLALPAVLLPLIAWFAVFGGYLVPAGDRSAGLIAVQHNASDENLDPSGTARALMEANPDFIALEEVTFPAVTDYETTFAAAYPHHSVQGTVALWSRYPLTEAAPADIRPASFGPDWNRGLRAVAQTPHGPVAVYVAHLPSIRIGVSGLESAARDESAIKLGALLKAEPLPRVIVLGDLNSTVQDRGLAPVLDHVTTSRDFAFSWPARFPVARIDQILARGLTVTDLHTLPRTGSDHLPIAARMLS